MNDSTLTNITDEQFEEVYFPQVLSNERLCRVMIQHFLKRGFTIKLKGCDFDCETLTYLECQELILKIYSELKKEELKQLIFEREMT